MKSCIDYIRVDGQRTLLWSGLGLLPDPRRMPEGSYALQLPAPPEPAPPAPDRPPEAQTAPEAPAPEALWRCHGGAWVRVSKAESTEVYAAILIAAGERAEQRCTVDLVGMFTPESPGEPLLAFCEDPPDFAYFVVFSLRASLERYLTESGIASDSYSVQVLQPGHVFPPTAVSRLGVVYRTRVMLDPVLSENGSEFTELEWVNGQYQRV